MGSWTYRKPVARLFKGIVDIRPDRLHQKWLCLCECFVEIGPIPGILGGETSNISYFHRPILGEDEPSLTIIFFKRVVSTTNQSNISPFWVLLWYPVHLLGIQPHPVQACGIRDRSFNQLLQRMSLAGGVSTYTKRKRGNQRRDEEDFRPQ